MKKAIISALTSALLLGGALALPAISAGSNKTITGCVNNKTQALRIVAKCVKGETKVTWNVQGEQGLQGEPGLQGLQGLQGIQGLPGAAGANGSSAVNLATNCYQWLMQAQNAGYIWNKVADRSRFESLTGCRVRDININPYSQVPEAVGGPWPFVTSSRLLSITGGSGDGSINQPGPASGGTIGNYEITASVPSGQILCSPNESKGSGQRVFVNPSNNKIYARAAIGSDHLKNTADIVIGSGIATASSSFDADEISNGSVRKLSADKVFAVEFERVPISVGLGSETLLKITALSEGSLNTGPPHFNLGLESDTLSKIEVAPDEAGYEAVLKFTANAHEPGQAFVNLVFYGDQSLNLVTYDVRFAINVGVESCFTIGPTAGAPITEWTNLYRIIEARNLADQNPDFGTDIGWVPWGWFPEPQV